MSVHFRSTHSVRGSAGVKRTWNWKSPYYKVKFSFWDPVCSIDRCINFPVSPPRLWSTYVCLVDSPIVIPCGKSDSESFYLFQLSCQMGWTQSFFLGCWAGMIWRSLRLLNWPIYVARKPRKPSHWYPGNIMYYDPFSAAFRWKLKPSIFSLAHKIDDEKVQELLNEMLTIKKFQG